MHKEKAPVYVWLDEHPSLRIPKGKVPGGRNVSADKGVVLRESGESKIIVTGEREI